MSLKTSVNRLFQLTGHQILKTSTLKELKRRAASKDTEAAAQRTRLTALSKALGQQAKQLATQGAVIATQSQRLQAQIGRIERLTAPKPKAPAKLPADYDETVKEIFAKVRDRTMTGHEKINFLSHAVRYAERYQIPGAFMECGVWRGGSMLAVAHTLDELGVHDRDLYLFDTFTGMTEPTDRDRHIWAKKSATEIMASHDKGAAPIWAIASLEDVQEGFKATSHPTEKIHYVVGKVEDTIPEKAPEQIAVLRLDTDWYESTKHEFQHLYSRLSPGGILIIDDYGSWQGSRDATDEFLNETGEPLMLTRVGRGRVAVKPGLQSRF